MFTLNETELKSIAGGCLECEEARKTFERHEAQALAAYEALRAEALSAQNITTNETLPVMEIAPVHNATQL